MTSGFIPTFQQGHDAPQHRPHPPNEPVNGVTETIITSNMAQAPIPLTHGRAGKLPDPSIPRCATNHRQKCSSPSRT